MPCIQVWALVSLTVIVKKESVSRTNLPQAKMVFVLICFFPLVGRLCSRGFYFTFWLSKWDFSRLFYTERSWWAYWFSVVLFLFVAERICLLMQEHFLWPLLKRKLNESLSFFKYCDQIVKNKYMFIFFQACERAESSKSCNLIASMKSGRYFTILPAEGPIVYYVAGWGGGGGGYNSRRLLILGGQFWKCTKCEWDRNFNTQDWHFM